MGSPVAEHSLSEQLNKPLPQENASSSQGGCREESDRVWWVGLEAATSGPTMVQGDPGAPASSGPQCLLKPMLSLGLARSQVQILEMRDVTQSHAHTHLHPKSHALTRACPKKHLKILVYLQGV